MKGTSYRASEDDDVTRLGVKARPTHNPQSTGGGRRGTERDGTERLPTGYFNIDQISWRKRREAVADVL